MDRPEGNHLTYPTKALDEGLPDGTKRLILPGIFGFALETAGRDRYLGRQLAARVSHVAAEAAWANAKTTSSRVSLTLDTPDVNGWRCKSPGKETTPEQYNAPR